MRFGVADMEASLVPRTGNQMGLSDTSWSALAPEERLGRVLDVVAASPFDFVELSVPVVRDN